MAEVIVAGPLKKLDLCDQNWLQPATVLHLRRRGVRRLVQDERRLARDAFAPMARGFLIDTSTPRSPRLDTYIPDSDKPLVQTTIAEAIRTKGMFQLEHRVIRADGTIGWTSSRALPFL